MLRVPKLPCSHVGNSRERAPAWRPPIRRENGLPNDKHAQILPGMPGQELLSCGGPPQTSCSSRGKKENQARRIDVGVKGLLELA